MKGLLIYYGSHHDRCFVMGKPVISRLEPTGCDYETWLQNPETIGGPSVLLETPFDQVRLC